MLKAGIFVDAENVSRNGGWNFRYDVLKRLVSVEHAVVRANIYLAIDQEREQDERQADYARKKEAYRHSLRSFGFKLVLKQVQRYRDEEGNLVLKANSDLDLATDALLQAQNLDYVLMVSGDGDFVRVVHALQDSGHTVDVMGFHNTSRALRDAADRFIPGLVVDGLIPLEEGRKRGIVHAVNEEKYYAHLTVYDGLRPAEPPGSVFLHGNDLEGGTLSNRQLAELKRTLQVIEFQPVQDAKGLRAVKAVRVLPDR